MKFKLWCTFCCVQQQNNTMGTECKTCVSTAKAASLRVLQKHVEHDLLRQAGPES